MSKRRFNEKEIGALIQRASEMHAESEGAEHTLSLEEIEHIAVELGLPAEHVRAAALELNTHKQSNKKTNFWGAPFVVEETRVVQQPLSDDLWEQLVLELQRNTNGTGKVSEIGKSRQWTRAVGEGDGGFNISKTAVTASADQDQTSIHIRKHFGGPAIIGYALAGFITVFSAFGIAIDGASPILAVMLAGVLFTLVRSAIWVSTKKQQDKIERLSNSVQQRLQDSTLESGDAGSLKEAEPAQSKLAIPDVEAPEVQEGSTTQSASRTRA